MSARLLYAEKSASIKATIAEMRANETPLIATMGNYLFLMTMLFDRIDARLSEVEDKIDAIDATTKDATK